MSYPVIYQPNGSEIGQATTRTGAIRVLRSKVSPYLSREKPSATLARQCCCRGGGLAWFTSYILRGTK